MTAPSERWCVVLIDGNGEPAVWLTDQLRATPAIFDAGAFAVSDAPAFARWAERHIGGTDGCQWMVDELPERELQRRHYGALIREAAEGVHLPGLASQ